MPKLPGWSRQQRRESRRQPYVWTHDDHDLDIMVKFNEGQYTVMMKAAGNPSIIDSFGGKRSARDRATEWMRQHPDGITR